MAPHPHDALHQDVVFVLQGLLPLLPLLAARPHVDGVHLLEGTILPVLPQRLLPLANLRQLPQQTLVFPLLPPQLLPLVAVQVLVGSQLLAASVLQVSVLGGSGRRG